MTAGITVSWRGVRCLLVPTVGRSIASAAAVSAVSAVSAAATACGGITSSLSCGVGWRCSRIHYTIGLRLRVNTLSTLSVWRSSGSELAIV